MILAIETSLKLGSIAVLSKGKLLGSQEIPEELSMSNGLLNAIDKLLKEIRIDLDELDLISVSQGPGSLTGIRIGISVGMGLAFSQGIRCVGISLLEAMKQKSKGKICISIIPGGAGYSYYQIFNREDKGSIEIIKNQEISEFLSAYTEIDLVIEKTLSEKIDTLLKYNVNIFAVDNLSELIAVEAYNKLINRELEDISPIYGLNTFRTLERV